MPRNSYSELSMVTIEGEIACRNCAAPEEMLEAKTTAIGQYLWSTCLECGADNLPNGTVRL